MNSNIKEQPIICEPRTKILYNVQVLRGATATLAVVRHCIKEYSNMLPTDLLWGRLAWISSSSSAALLFI